MRYGKKMGGRVGMRGAGPYEVARANGYEVTLRKNGRDRTLPSKYLKVCRVPKASQKCTLPLKV